MCSMMSSGMFIPLYTRMIFFPHFCILLYHALSYYFLAISIFSRNTAQNTEYGIWRRIRRRIHNTEYGAEYGIRRRIHNTEYDAEYGAEYRIRNTEYGNVLLFRRIGVVHVPGIVSNPWSRRPTGRSAGFQCGCPTLFMFCTPFNYNPQTIECIIGYS